MSFLVDEAHDTLGHGKALFAVIGDAELVKKIGKTHDAEADFTVLTHLLVNLSQRIPGSIDNVVEKAHGQTYGFPQFFPVHAVFQRIASRIPVLIDE